MPPILNLAEQAREREPRVFGPGVSEYEMLVAISDAARRANHALRNLSAELIMTAPDARPRVLEDGRVSVTVEAWNAMAHAREATAALIALAVSGDPEHRG